MRDRITIYYEMKLLSDTIPGAGYSIPGGVDISVCKDETGYPFFRGSTIKGLLRESVENLIIWGVVDKDKLIQMFGDEGRDGKVEVHRINLSPATLKKEGLYVDDCYTLRAFSSLEEGVTKKGSLRNAECVKKGLVFAGSIECHIDDKDIVLQALDGIKWVGTLRNRGFGHVDITYTLCEAQDRGNLLSEVIMQPDGSVFIRYILHADTPIIMTDKSRSFDNSYQTRKYISGSAIRGLVMGKLAECDNEWFEINKEKLLSSELRFFNTLCTVNDLSPLPSIKGFYERKDGSGFVSVLKDGDLPQGVKRANVGSLCAIQDNRIVYWDVNTSGTARIKKAGRAVEDDEKKVFRNRYIEAGQNFEGYIKVSSREIAERIIKSISGDLWIGADRYEGYGKCHIEKLDIVNEPEWISEYGYRDGDSIGDTLYLLAVSPFTMLNETGEPVGINSEELAKKLGLTGGEDIDVELCSTSVSDFGGYNRTWKCELPLVRMYDMGSIFKIKCRKAPELSAIRNIENEGIGIRKAEGFGNVLFIKPSLFEKIDSKEALINNTISEDVRKASLVRRAKLIWIMNHAEDLSSSIETNGTSYEKNSRLKRPSKSQIGQLQALCEKAVSMAENDELNLDEIRKFFDNQTSNKASRDIDYSRIIEIFNDVTTKTMNELINVECMDSSNERMKLFCELIDFSRKEA